MCLVITALDAHPRYALVVAANRDESHARAALPARWGDAAPFRDILAGRDLAAGGTWMGVRRDGRWALVTNVRLGNSRNDPAAPSRGALVPAILNDDADPASALTALMRPANAYNGFNLLAGDADHALWASNRSPHARTLHAGTHGLSNALLDTPWPKLVRTRDAVAAWAASDNEDLAPVFAALADRTLARDDALPSTGVPIEWERQLSAPFIVGDDYGTRCSTVLVIARTGRARWVERTFDARGIAAGEVEFEFDVPRGTA
jgi:uncharacterized protein with NRDE domain